MLLRQLAVLFICALSARLFIRLPRDSEPKELARITFWISATATLFALLK